MSSFEKNLPYFELNNPRGTALLALADASHLAITKTEIGEPNLSGPAFSYHSNQGALREQREALFSLPLQSIQVLYLFGVGLGYAYDVLHSWLSEDSSRYLIFLEDDLSVIAFFLESERATSILQNPQVRLMYIEDSAEGIEVIQGLAWGVFPKTIGVAALPIYKKTKEKIFEDLQKRIFYETQELHAVLDEYSHFGVAFFRNFWKNILVLPQSYRGASLFSAFSNIPAICVGAGPSLSKQIPLLKEMSDRALIFAGGSSVNALVDAGLTPHFAAGIDPNPLQYLRLRQSSAFATPFFYRHRLLHEALELVTGAKLYLPGGDGYNISEYFEEKLKIGGKVLGGGHSVSNFLIEIAYALGCKKIILVGYDLAFSDNRSYASGVEEDSAVSYAHRTIEQNAPILWDDVYGKKVYTQWKWLVEAEWITEFKAKHRSLKLLNATEGGIGMRGVPNITLAKACARFLNKQYDLKGIVHMEVEQAGALRIVPKKVLALMSNMYDSLDRSVAILDEMISALQQKAQSSFFETGEGALLFDKLTNEIAFHYVLEVFFRMKTKIDYMYAQFMNHPDLREGLNECKQLEERFLFLKEVAIVNKLLMAQALQEYVEKGRSLNGFSPKAKVLWS